MLLNGSNTAIKYGNQNLSAVYRGSDKIWPVAPPAPSGFYVPGDYSGAFLGDVLGRAVSNSDIGHFMFPPEDTGFDALWPDQGTLTPVVEGVVVLMTQTTRAMLARGGASFQPFIAHNGKWWRMTAVNTGLSLTTYDAIFREGGNNTFQGFWIKSKSYGGMSSARYTEWGNNFLNNEQFAVVVDVVNHRMELAAGSQNMANKLDFTGAHGSGFFAYHLPSGMTDADVFWPEAPKT